MTEKEALAAIRAEVERLKSKNNCGTEEFIEAKNIAYNQILSIIDTLEVGEVGEKGVAIVDTVDNYSGHQTINTIRFVGEDEDKPKPLPCKYYHVWMKAAKEEEL